jgi:hypothetical protein
MWLAIDRSLQGMNKQLETANQMHGELNRAAQWIIDPSRESSRKLRHRSPVVPCG